MVSGCTLFLSVLLCPSALYVYQNGYAAIYNCNPTTQEEKRSWWMSVYSKPNRATKRYYISKTKMNTFGYGENYI